MKKQSIISWALIGLVFLLSSCHLLKDKKGPPPVVYWVPNEFKISDWKKVTAQAPTPDKGPTLWLDASTIKSTKDIKEGEHLITWEDLSVNGNSVSRKNGEKGPSVLPKAINQKAVVHFTGNQDTLRRYDVPGTSIVTGDGATVFMVVRLDDYLTVNKSDPYGWGDCGNNRFNTHINGEWGVYFHMGDPKFQIHSPKRPPEWVKGFHIISFVRNGKDARVDADGVTWANNSNFDSKLGIDAKGTLYIGGGVCGSGFKGDMAEFILYPKGLDKDNQAKITKYLAEKYKISLK
jgi:hypothetical protein